ncbi:polygalacturonase-like protein [Tanacetum coccineum]
MQAFQAGYEFLVGPISLSGPYCQRNILFQLDGTIIAPTNANAWVKVSSSLERIMPSTKRTALRFYGSFNVMVIGKTIRHTPQYHLKFDNCNGVLVYSLSVSSPRDSPNTDGIHLQNSQNV